MKRKVVRIAVILAASLSLRAQISAPARGRLAEAYPYQLVDVSPFAFKLDMRTGQLWLFKYADLAVQPPGAADTSIWQKVVNANALADGSMVGRFVLNNSASLLIDQIGGEVWVIKWSYSYLNG